MYVCEGRCGVLWEFERELRECVCCLGVSSCPPSYLMFSSAGPERALAAALCLFSEALRFVGIV